MTPASGELRARLAALEAALADKDAEIARLSEALVRIRDQPKSFRSRSISYGMGWAFYRVQSIARDILTSQDKGA